LSRADPAAPAAGDGRSEAGRLSLYSRPRGTQPA